MEKKEGKSGNHLDKGKKEEKVENEDQLLTIHFPFTVSPSLVSLKTYKKEKVRKHNTQYLHCNRFVYRLQFRFFIL